MMNPTIVFLWSIPVFVILMCVPIIVLVCFAIFKNVRKLTNKQATVTWVCIIGYYVVFFTQVPMITRPYFVENSHEVTECTVKRVWNHE